MNFNQWAYKYTRLYKSSDAMLGCLVNDDLPPAILHWYLKF